MAGFEVCEGLYLLAARFGGRDSPCGAADDRKNPS